MIVFVFLLSLAIGIGLAFQMKISDGQRLYVSSKTIQDYQTTIESEKQEIERLRGLIEENREKLSVYEAAESSTWQAREVIREQLVKDVELFKIAGGMEKVVGPGVEVVIDDGTRPLFSGEDINNLLVHDMDILLLISELNRCGAEAISVNGQRIGTNTSIACSGYTVRINGEVYARPFKIKAIGDGKRMVAALVAPDGYGASLKNWGIQFEVRLSDNVEIEPLGGMYLYRYMNKLNQGEVVN